MDESSNLSIFDVHIAKGGTVWNIATDSQFGRFSKQNVPYIDEGSIFHVIQVITNGNVVNS